MYFFPHLEICKVGESSSSASRRRRGSEGVVSGRASAALCRARWRGPRRARSAAARGRRSLGRRRPLGSTLGGQRRGRALSGAAGAEDSRRLGARRGLRGGGVEAALDKGEKRRMSLNMMVNTTGRVLGEERRENSCNRATTHGSEFTAAEVGSEGAAGPERIEGGHGGEVVCVGRGEGLLASL